jgi:hypothetical protein
MRTPPGVTLSWAQTAALNPATPICLRWGAQLPRFGARCCLSCRALDLQLKPSRDLPPARLTPEKEEHVMLPATAADLIALLCQPGMESAWRSERRSDSSFHAGFAPPGGDGYDVLAALPASWQLVPEWGDWPYLIGWRHNRDRAVMTYCEGDLSVEVADDHDAYLDLLRRTTADMPASEQDAARFLTRISQLHVADRSKTGPAAL